MTHESRYAALRPIHPLQDNSPLADLLFDADVKRADTWLAHVAELKQRRQALQEQLDAKAVADEATTLAPLREAAAAALDVHIAASAALETARMRSESNCVGLRNQIDDLTRQMAAPMYPIPTAWKDADAQIDAREATAAAGTPMKAGGGWVDNKAIDPGMPATFN